jgi:hypothetical protein
MSAWLRAVAAGLCVPLGLAALVLPGCGGEQLSAQSAKAEQPGDRNSDRVKVVVSTSEQTNKGGVIQVVVRKTRESDYRRVEYQDIVQTLELDSDPDTLVWKPLLAGSRVSFDVPRPGPDEALGVYFLFLDPGPDWKQLITSDVDQIEYRLGKDGVDDVVQP